LKSHFPDAAPFTVNELLRWPGVIEEAEINAESLQNTIIRSINDTLEAFITSREREGAALEQVLLSRVAAMEEIVERIKPLMPQMLQQFQQKSIARLEEALGLAQPANGNAAQTITREEAFDRIRQEVTCTAYASMSRKNCPFIRTSDRDTPHSEKRRPGR
jgi:uncharacterized protein (TIGR00255 family)